MIKANVLSKLTPEQAQKADYDRYFVKHPKDFSPTRNKTIVEQTIKDYEAMRIKKAKQFDDHYAERADAVITYLRSLDRGGATSSLEKYFGKRMLAHLRGQQIRDMLMAGMRVKNKQGEILKPGGV